jgi:predicted dehydrogenase
MKLAFIGANGHRYLAGLLKNAAEHGITHIACAGDGMDNAKARAWYDGLKAALPIAWFDDPMQMLDTFKPDVVNLGVRYGLNGDFAARVLQRDILLCSDKPIAATADQLETLRKLTAENPSRVIVSEFPCRNNAPFRAARQAVREGLIGQVVMATAQKSYRFGQRDMWYADRAQYGGTVLWVASHAIDYIHYVTGLKYTSVSGISGNLSRPEYGSMEEFTISTFTLENGGGAMVHADYNRPAAAPTHGDDRLRVVGSQGQLEIIGGQCVLMTHDQPPRDIAQGLDAPAIGVELWQALQSNNTHPLYNTQASLSIAGAMLAARDAIDRRTTLPVTM